MRLAEIRVLGVKPAPKGSVKNFAAKDRTGRYTGKVARKDSSATLKAYTDALKAEASFEAELMALDGVRAPYEGPVKVQLRVFIARPARGEYANPVGPNHGDTDKFQRAVGDALEAGGVIKNDSQIIRWDAAKCYAPVHFTLVTVDTMEDAEMASLESLAAHLQIVPERP